MIVWTLSPQTLSGLCECYLIYIYIYIYIMKVLVVNKSLCGYVSNQAQYNIESAIIIM